MEFLKSKKDITLQPGCWRLLRQRKRQLSGLISQRCTRTQSNLSKSLISSLFQDRDENAKS